MQSLELRRNVTTSIFSFSANILFTFLGYRLLLQHGGTEALGLWAVLNASIYIIKLGDVGLGSAAERQISTIKKNDNIAVARDYLDTALLLNGIIFALITFFCFILLNSFTEWFVGRDSHTLEESRKILPLMLTGFFVSTLANIILGGLRGLHLAWKASYLSIGASFIQMITTLILVPHFGIHGLAWAQLNHALITGLGGWLIIYNHIKSVSRANISIFPISAKKSLFRELFDFSIRAQFINLMNSLFEPASKLMINHTAGFSILAIYEMAYKMVALPRNAVIAGIQGMTPALTHLLSDDHREALRLFKLSQQRVMISSGFVLLLAALCSPLASFILLNRIDCNLIIFVSLIALGFWGNSIGATSYALGFASGNMRGNLWSTLFSLLSLFVGGLIFAHLSPTYGVVIACSTSLAAGGLIIKWLNGNLINQH